MYFSCLFICCSARGTNAVALGLASANANDSVAIGNRAIASNDSSVALGTDSRVDKQTLDTVAYLTGLRNIDMLHGVVSVGSTQGKEFNHRIMNVAGGVHDFDAVNVAQLKVLDNKITAVENNLKNVSYGTVSS